MKVLLRVLGIIAACIGIYFSVNMMNTGKDMIDASEKIKIPEKHVYVSSLSSAYYADWDENRGAEYLGGDAYNYIVEASLKAGYYNATVTTKTAKEVGGNVIRSLSIFSLFVSIFFLFFSLYSLMNCQRDTKHPQSATEDDKAYRSFVLQHLQNIEEYTTANRNNTERYRSDENYSDDSCSDENYTDESNSEEDK